MPIGTHPATTDLMLPLPPEGAGWDGHTIHTHYFGLTVPEAALGAFIYLRYQPVYRLVSGGLCVFRGLDNHRPLDITHLDFVNTMPWPEVTDGEIRVANGLSVRFVEPGRIARVRYAGGNTELDVTQTALTPLLARGHVMPGEDEHGDQAAQPGGSEQFMHCTGTITVDGEQLTVDCHAIRDRSWRQVRTEAEVPYPPVGWSPMYFGEDLAFNQVGFEDPDSDPVWAGHFPAVAGRPSHHYGWVIVDGEVRELAQVRRRVLERHPVLHAAIRQEIEARDEAGQVHRFAGEALAISQLPSWPNNVFTDSVYRWTDERGRVTHCTYQEAWYATFQRLMRRRTR